MDGREGEKKGKGKGRQRKRQRNIEGSGNEKDCISSKREENFDFFKAFFLALVYIKHDFINIWVRKIVLSTFTSELNLVNIYSLKQNSLKNIVVLS